MIKQIAKSVVPDHLWKVLSGQRAEAEEAIEQLGLRPGVNFLVSLLTDRLSKGLPARPRGIRRLRLKGYKYPISYRLGTSDINVINQVFVKRQYECVAYEKGISLIIDCGANIGCASLFFLHQFPTARVIAVEPDPGNFAMCRRNLEPFGDRVQLVNAGIWPTDGPLRVVRGAFGDGREWSFQVRPTLPGEQPDLMGTTIPGLIDGLGFRNVDLLKIDIESAEKELFSSGVEKWLPRTNRLVIELHGTDCERVFFEAMAGYCSKFETSGELTVCRGIGNTVGIDPRQF